MSAAEPIQHSTFNIQHSRFFIMIAAIALLAFAKPLIKYEVPTFRDHSDYFQPLRWFTASELRHGRLPLWNVYSASGERWLANPQTCVFYPPAWVFLFLPFPTAYTLFLALHVMLLGCGAFLLFRRFASEMAALAAALALMFCGPAMSLVDINNNLATFAWLPLVLWCALGDVGPQTQRSGHRHVVPRRRAVLRRAGAAAFALIRRRNIINVALTSIALSAIQLFPFLELIRGSDRAGVAREDLLWDSMPLRDWLGVVSPVRLDMTQHFISVVYVGLLASVLAIVGLAVGRWPLAVRLSAAAVIFVSIVVSAGAYFAPTAFLLKHLPVMFFRFPARVVPLAAIAICLLAAMGADRAVRPRWLVLVAVVMCVDPLLRTLPLLESAPFDPHPTPYDRVVGRDAKFVRIGFGRS